MRIAPEGKLPSIFCAYLSFPLPAEPCVRGRWGFWWYELVVAPRIQSSPILRYAKQCFASQRYLEQTQAARIRGT